MFIGDLPVLPSEIISFAPPTPAAPAIPLASSAAGVPYVASQSSVLAGQTASYANLTDGDYTNGGCTNSAANGFIAFTFPSRVSVSSVRMGAGNQNNIGGISTPANQSIIQYSDDGITWTTFLTPSGFTGSTQFIDFPIVPPVTGQYFRLMRDANGGIVATTEMVFT